mmetsp:Transcript_79334/g.233059  ORF Transcript_79334/g.233059 Transcript_79334/m.233059 type:complete len:500 (-) Transcript_79334:40-1539(-)
MQGHGSGNFAPVMPRNAFDRTMTMGMQSPWSNGSNRNQSTTAFRVVTPPPPALVPRAPGGLIEGGEDPFFSSGALTPRRTEESMMAANPYLDKNQDWQKEAGDTRTFGGYLSAEVSCTSTEAGQELRGGAAAGGAAGEPWAPAERDGSLAPAAPHAAAGFGGVPPPPPPQVCVADIRSRRMELQKTLTTAMNQYRHQDETPQGDSADEGDEGSGDIRPRPPRPEELPLPSVTGPATASSPPSLGSAGHPTCCEEPCRYVKREGGCRDGADCKQCHLCFWHRRSVVARQLIRLGIAPEQVANSSTTQPCPNSVGTMGHPYSCGEPCKYVRRRTGCRDGACCRKCHACQWRRRPLMTDGAAAQSYEEGEGEECIFSDQGLGAAPVPPMPRSLSWLEPDSQLRFEQFIPSPPGLEIGLPSEPPCACPPMSNLGSKDAIPTSVGSAGHPRSCNAPCKYARRKGGCREGAQCWKCHICRWSRKRDGNNEQGDEEDSMRYPEFVR